MNEQALTAEQILDAAEDVLRRYGPAKANVVDVARALGVSHGSVYRHFASKAALRNAVIKRWLTRVSQPLESIVKEQGPARARLVHWFETLRSIKLKKVAEDPTIFAAYHALALDAGDSVAVHIGHLTDQLAAMIGDGVTTGEFAPQNAVESARALFDATMRYHNPAYAAEWQAPDNLAAFERLLTLLLRGLSAR
jgi:AcrR family transcriptional regulator